MMREVIGGSGKILSINIHEPRHYPGICQPGELILPYSVRSGPDEPARHFGLGIGRGYTHVIGCHSIEGDDGERINKEVFGADEDRIKFLMSCVMNWYRSGKTSGRKIKPLEFVNMGGESDLMAIVPGIGEVRRQSLAYLDFGVVARQPERFMGLGSTYAMPLKVYVLGQEIGGDNPKGYTIKLPGKTVDESEFEKIQESIRLRIEDTGLSALEDPLEMEQLLHTPRTTETSIKIDGT